MPGIEAGSAQAVGPAAVADASSGRSLLVRFAGIGGTIAAIWLVAASRWIAVDGVVPWDSKNQFYAFFKFLASAIHSGSSPFWNPYHYGGHPAVADPQSLIFAPLFVLWAWFDPAPSLRAFDVVVYAHLLLGGLALAALGLRAGWPAAACVLAAVVFMFGGAAAGRLQHTGIIITYAMFPPALLLLQLALQRRSMPLAVAFSLVAAALVLGRNQVALLLSVMLVALLVREVAVAERPLCYLRERAAVLATMAFVVAALVAVPLLLTLQFAVLSNRPAIELARALDGSLYPANLATLLVANIFGSHEVPYPYWGPNHETAPAVASTDQSFNYMFVGAVPVVLLLWFGLAGGWGWRRGRRLVAAFLIVALLFALGRYTPLFAWAFVWLPGVDMFRRPVDANFAFMAALAPLAGYLLADYIRGGLPPRRIVLSLLVTAGTLALVASAIVFSQRSGRAGAALIEVLKTAPIPILVIVLLAWARSARARAWCAGIVVAIAAVELVWWNAATRLNAEDRPYYMLLDRPGGEDGRALDALEQAIRQDHRDGERPRVEVVGVGGPWQNVAVARGFEAINGYNPLRIGLYDRLVSPGETTYDIAQRRFPASFDGYDCALARVLGLRYVVLDRPIERIPGMAKRKAAELLHAGPGVWIYRLRNAAPRLKFTRRVQIADAETTTATGRLQVEPSPDYVLIDNDTPPSRPYWAAEAVAGPARIVSWRPDRVEIEVDSQHGGVLALHDVYYPGWIAEIDGRQVPILRADVLFRGVEVPPGPYRVVFRFAPFSLDNLTRAFGDLLRRRDGPHQNRRRPTGSGRLAHGP